jgi:hypothetical protein
LVDGMWLDAEVFLWPAFGWEMTLGEGRFWPGAWQRALSDPWRWILEAAGVGYLVWLGRTAGLAEPSRRERLWATGRLDGT